MCATMPDLCSPVDGAYGFTQAKLGMYSTNLAVATATATSQETRYQGQSHYQRH